MVLQLAKKYHDKSGLHDRLIANRPESNVLPEAVESISLVKGDRSTM